MSKSYSARTVPVLHALLCDLGAKASQRGASPGDAQILRLAQEELHRVLAVVKAAKLVCRVPMEGRSPAVQGVHRAIARLDKANRRKP